MAGRNFLTLQLCDDISDNEKNMQIHGVDSADQLWNKINEVRTFETQKSERFEKAWRKIARHDQIPTFMSKSKSVDGNILINMLPRKSQVLYEHLMALEFPLLEEEIFDLKFVLYHKQVCDRLDSQPTTLMPNVALNTAKLR